MRKKIMLAIFLVYSVFLFACSDMKREPENGGASGTDDSGSLSGVGAIESGLPETEAGNAENIYYRMTYTKEVSADEVMAALLTKEEEKAAYQAAEVQEMTSKYTGLTWREGSMSVDGIVYRWSEGNGAFTYSVDRPYESISEEKAEELARGFLERLGWDGVGELQIKTIENGTVETECRLYYEDVKLMGENSLFFEPDNEDEVPVTGFCISMHLSGDWIQSVSLDAIPQAGEILQTYDAANDFITVEEAEAAVKQYFEVRQRPWTGTGIETEIIYMPYRDLANGDVHVLMPVFEVYVPNAPDEFVKAYLVYVDAVTGYIYDHDAKF